MLDGAWSLGSGRGQDGSPEIAAKATLDRNNAPADVSKRDAAVTAPPGAAKILRHPPVARPYAPPVGLFRRRAPEEPWTPPVPGACACDEHVEALRTVTLPRTSDSGDVTVGALLASGELRVEPGGDEPTYALVPLTGQRVGPFHWRVTLEDEAHDLFLVDAAAALDDCLAVQPGVERVVWPEPGVLLVGAPELCPSGVLAAVVRALENPRVRLPATGA